MGLGGVCYHRVCPCNDRGVHDREGVENSQGIYTMEISLINAEYQAHIYFIRRLFLCESMFVLSLHVFMALTSNAERVLMYYCSFVSDSLMLTHSGSTKSHVPC